MKILLADDDRISRRLLERTLESSGYQVVTAGDGEEAWRILEGVDAPNLAILDWMMPRLDGVTLCRRLRARPGAAYVYILILTGRDRTEDLVEALEAGADDFISKPHNNAELRARVRTGQRLLALEEALRHSATLDALTGLLNRAAILGFLDRELARARREGTRVALVMGDVDRFKSINDRHGHAAGDAVLREVAARLRAAVRTYDGVGRLGGEEFVLILPQMDVANALRVGERVRSSVAGTPMAIDGQGLPVTISLGVALSDPARSGAELLKLADTALYRAKNGGRDRVVLADDARADDAHADDAPPVDERPGDRTRPDDRPRPDALRRDA